MLNTVTTRWKGDLRFESDNPRGICVTMDTDVEGKEREGLSPKAMMLSSLAGCSGLDVISILDKMKMPLEDLKIEVTGELTNEHPKYYKKVNLEYHFYGNELKKEKCKKAVQLSVDKYCGVMAMFRQFAEISIAIKYHVSTIRQT